MTPGELLVGDIVPHHHPRPGRDFQRLQLGKYEGNDMQPVVAVTTRTQEKLFPPLLEAEVGKADGGPTGGGSENGRPVRGVGADGDVVATTEPGQETEASAPRRNDVDRVDAGVLGEDSLRPGKNQEIDPCLRITLLNGESQRRGEEDVADIA
jgi:hypothetical protein